MLRGTGDAGVGRHATDPRERGRVPPNVTLLGEACHPAVSASGWWLGAGDAIFKAEASLPFPLWEWFQNGPRAGSLGTTPVSPRGLCF